MVCAPFTVLNHLRQLICFGAGLLRDEKVESFQWLFCLFNSFLVVMGSHMLKIVITDQYTTIRQVIVNVFKTSIHRFCMWHIMRKLPEKVSCKQNGCKDFIEHIKGCVWASDSSNEFEKSWGEMLEEFNLTDNEWLRYIYEI